MELTEGSETSANHNLTPGKYPKEYIQYSKHGESLKSTYFCVQGSIINFTSGFVNGIRELRGRTHVTDTILCCLIFMQLSHSLHIYRCVFISFLHGAPSLRATLVRLLLLLLLLFLRLRSCHTKLL
jgi:hypothetical protein